MKLHSGPKSFWKGVLSAFAMLLLTGTLAHAQTPVFYQLDWFERFNNSLGSETEDNWVANSYTASGQGFINSIVLPIGDTFNNQPISAFIYQGFDLHDPTAGGGLVLLAEKDTTFSSTPGTVLTITFDNQVAIGAGAIFYAAVLIPGVSGNVFPFYLDSATNPSNTNIGTVPFGRSFFDIGSTFGGPFDVNQGSANITVTGGNHPILGGSAQDAGNLALWVIGQ
jgi:hypothetical protein